MKWDLTFFHPSFHFFSFQTVSYYGLRGSERNLDEKLISPQWHANAWITNEIEDWIFQQRTDKKKNKTNLILWLFEKKNLREKKTTANMANKGEDSNTTPTDDNISLNEVKYIWFIFIKMKWNMYACLMAKNHFHFHFHFEYLHRFNHIKT